MLDKIRNWLSDVRAKAKVLATAWPAWAAAITSVVTFLSVELVPRLPGDWPLKAAGWLAAVVVAVSWISAAVARVTPVLFAENQGLLAPPPAQSPTPVAGTFSTLRSSSVSSGDPLPPVPPEAYPPGSEQLPHRRR
jgi:hypothetical protein